MPTNPIKLKMNKLNIKPLLFVVAILFMASKINAQDLIVTNEGDSLNCKITKVKSEFIYFTFKHNDEYRNTLMALEDVKYHQFNFYQTSEVPESIIVKYIDYPQFRLAITGGYAYRTGKLPDGVGTTTEEYLKDLKSGFHIGADATYFFSEFMGVGMKYDVFRSKSEYSKYSFSAVRSNEDLSDDMTINFIGPLFVGRFYDSDKQNCFVMDLGMGYLGYNDDAHLSSDFNIKGATVGLCWDFGYDITLSKNVAIGLQLSFMLGTLTQYKTNEYGNYETVELDEDLYEDLNRVDLSIGIRFNN